MHTAVWTGSEMIVWGGKDADRFGDGGRYSPASNTWVPIGINGAPSPRTRHTAVWTGTEMIIWGGAEGFASYLGDGGRYRPASGTWELISAVGGAPGRFSHNAVWTGFEMIVWGGVGSSGYDLDTWYYTPPKKLYIYQKQ
jgi:hypothetical protein